MKGNVLITGGLGFVGSHIADSLAKQNERRIFVYDVSTRDNGTGNITIRQGDIFDTDRLLKTMIDGEISDVVHMVGLASVPMCKENPDTSLKLNVASVQAVLEAMRQSKAERIVFPSTAAIYGASNGPKVNEEIQPEPRTVYGSHKLAAEKLIHEYAENYGFKPTILRLFNVYGDLEKEQGVISLFLRKAIAHEPLIIRGGDQLRDFVFLHDVVKAFSNTLDNTQSHNQTINVGSGVGVTINEIAQMVHQNIPATQIKYEPPNGNEYSIYADIQRMKKILAFTPVAPETGISAFIKQVAKNSVKELANNS
jgi:UDP-glucose 4-epimerase